MRSIAILGAGELGGALARQLAAVDIAQRLVLVDDAAKIAEGKALDIRQAAPVDGYSSSLVGTNDEAAVVGASAIVLADRATNNAEWQDDHGVALVRRVVHLNPKALVICAGARQMDVVERSVREGGLDARRVLGSAPEALRSAVLSMVALEAGCAPSEISLTVVGRPPNQTIVPWEDASIAGRRATDVLSPGAIVRLDGRLSRLWPQGPLTLAAAATRLLRAAANRSNHTFSAFVVAARDGVMQERVGALPVLLGHQGVTAIINPALNARDRVRLDTALHR